MSAVSHTENLVRSVYVSVGTAPLDQSALYQLLEVSRHNNARLNVSGILLYVDDTFFQVLEGEESAVDTLYDKIEQDARHHRCMKLIREVIETRDFGEWSMGYAGITKTELRQMEGLNDFFISGHCLMDLDKGRSRKLLTAFSEGAWRSSVR